MTNTFIVDSVGGISGSLTQLVDGTSYLVAGPGVAITSQSNGSVVVASSVSSAPMMQTASFTANGTWTSPVTGPVMLIGFGGGGGGGGGASDASATTGGGGGGGSLQSTTVVFVTLASSYSVTIGAGGSGGAGHQANHGSNGGNGGDTSFGSLAIFQGASGGGGGRSSGFTYVGGGLCCTNEESGAIATNAIQSLMQTYSNTVVPLVVYSMACGGHANSGNPAHGGNRNCVGGFAGGLGSSTASGGAGGGAGPRGRWQRWWRRTRVFERRSWVLVS